MKKTLFILFLSILFGCKILPPEPPTIDPVIIDNGPLPNSALKFIPYQNGKTYKFRHSNGLIINFKTFIETRKESYCTRCCEYKYHFEISKITLTPDYPIFNFYFEISNRDTLHIRYYASIGKYRFYIPTTNSNSNNTEMLASIMVASIVYKNVFKLKLNYNSSYNKDSIYTKTLFYNYEYGILKILMSNGESYERLQ